MAEEVREKLSKRFVLLIILISLALLSVFVVSKTVTAPSFNAETQKSLDDKKVTVMKLAATAAASSTALSLIPGDTAMPIANQIAELSTYFIIILGAILLEKILVSVVGYVSFSIIIPLACTVGILYLYTKKEYLKVLAIKLMIFGVVIFVAIPTSVKISDLVDYTYKSSLEQTIEAAEDNREYIEDKKEDLSVEDTNWMDKIGGYLSNITSTIEDGVSSMVKKGEDTLCSFLDAIAILVITSCVVPIVVMLIFVWLVKILFSFSVRSNE